MKVQDIFWIVVLWTSCAECFVLNKDQVINGHRINKRGNRGGQTVGAAAPLTSAISNERQLETNKLLCESCMRTPACKMSPECRFCAAICARANINPAVDPEVFKNTEDPLARKDSSDVVGQKAPDLSARFDEVGAGNPTWDYYPVGKLDSRNAIGIICRMLGVKNVKEINNLLVLATMKSDQPPLFNKRIMGLSATEAFKLPEALNGELSKLVNSKPNGVVSNEEIDQAVNSALNNLNEPSLVGEGSPQENKNDPELKNQEQESFSETREADKEIENIGIPETNSRMGEEENVAKKIGMTNKLEPTKFEEKTNPEQDILSHSDQVAEGNPNFEANPNLEEVGNAPENNQNQSSSQNNEKNPETKKDLIEDKEKESEVLGEPHESPESEHDNPENLGNHQEGINNNEETLGKKFVHFSKGPHHSSYQSHKFFRSNEENDDGLVDLPEEISEELLDEIGDNLGAANEDLSNKSNDESVGKEEPHHDLRENEKQDQNQDQNEPLVENQKEEEIGESRPENMDEEKDEEKVGIKNFHLWADHEYDPHFRGSKSQESDAERGNAEEEMKENEPIFRDNERPALSSANQQLEQKSADEMQYSVEKEGYNPENNGEELQEMNEGIVDDNPENYPVINLEPAQIGGEEYHPDQPEMYQPQGQPEVYQEPQEEVYPQPEEPYPEPAMNYPENYENPSVGEAAPEEQKTLQTNEEVPSEPPKLSLLDRLRNRLNEKKENPQNPEDPEDVLGKKHVKFVMRPAKGHKKFRDNDNDEQEEMPAAPKQEEAPILMEETPEASAAHILPAKKYPEVKESVPEMDNLKEGQESLNEQLSNPSNSNPTVGSPQSGIPGLDLAHGITKLVEKNLNQDDDPENGVHLAKDITKEVFKNSLVGAENPQGLGHKIGDLVRKNLNSNQDEEGSDGVQLAKDITSVVGDELKEDPSVGATNDGLGSPIDEEEVGKMGKDIAGIVESSKNGLENLFHQNPLGNLKNLKNPLEGLKNPLESFKNPLEGLENPLKELTGLPNIPKPKAANFKSEEDGDNEESEEEEEEVNPNQEDEAVGKANPIQDILVPNPDLENRNHDMQDSPDWSNNFGQLMPSSNSSLFFIGNGIKLPLQMHKNNDGSVDLSVDLDKLCNCNSSCPKNQKSIEEAVGTILEKEAELKTQLSHLEEQQNTSISPESAVDTTENPELVHKLKKRDLSRILAEENNKNPINHPAINYKIPLADKSKTKGRSNSLGNRQSPNGRYSEKDDDLMQIRDTYKFRKLERDLEEHLQKLSENVQKFNKDNELMLDKNVKTLFKANENEVIKQQVDIVSNVLEWMKNYATKDRN